MCEHGDESLPALLPDLMAPAARAGLPAPLPLPAGATDLQADPLAPLLATVAPTASLGVVAGRVRRRLLERVAASAAAARTVHTVRRRERLPLALAAGVTMQRLYSAVPGGPRRAGEPDRVALVALAPGAAWDGSIGLHDGGPALQREWLVLHGSLQIGATALQAHDYHVVPAGMASGRCSSAAGALLYQRESRVSAGAPAGPVTQRVEVARWEGFAPGVKRRLLWQQGAQAAMLYHGLPGAAVPHHGHGHDEECLLLAGDFFLDEVLLRPLDYQIAPAGSEHHVSHTDTGVLIYAHGDLQLELR